MKSKKLTGNGLWESSRMMLPQHREALLAQGAERPVAEQAIAARPEKRDTELIREYIMLPLAKQVIVKAAQAFREPDHMLARCAEVAVQIIVKRMNGKLLELQREMEQRHVQVVRTGGDADVQQYRYACRGYEGELALTRAELKAEVAARIERYRDGFVRDVRAALS
ncbi:hypothetical protein B5M42_023025 [Paenibacillus athensensis]|uniref:Uncharacterized protein n=1 Tax=Paenibacillus athensensis TaxID=1967502 RepID=A0A4Y8PQG9_9BACL|nr:hypothetical protein [Paenibacillus athensensis]MCD1261680.1 hypothetical protein [Paenibacillus athensensis]